MIWIILLLAVIGALFTAVFMVESEALLGSVIFYVIIALLALAVGLSDVPFAEYTVSCGETTYTQAALKITDDYLEIKDAQTGKTFYESGPCMWSKN